MTNRIVTTPIPPIVLRMLEPIRISACKGGFLIDASQRGRSPRTSESSAASLRIGRGGAGKKGEKSDEGDESNHGDGTGQALTSAANATPRRSVGSMWGQTPMMTCAGVRPR